MYRMPQWRDFLERFRPAGTPGAAVKVAFQQTVPPKPAKESSVRILGPGGR